MTTHNTPRSSCSTVDLCRRHPWTKMRALHLLVNTTFLSFFFSCSFFFFTHVLHFACPRHVAHPRMGFESSGLLPARNFVSCSVRFGSVQFCRVRLVPFTFFRFSSDRFIFVLFRFVSFHVVSFRTFFCFSRFSCADPIDPLRKVTTIISVALRQM